MFSFCPDVVNTTACPTADATNPTPVCGLLRECANASGTDTCSLEFASGCLACQNQDISMILNGSCTLETASLNSLAALWR